jgi:hypothetical protein
MISFQLKCANGHEFDGWFASSKAFEDQKTTGDLTCPNCGNGDVDKALMAPNLAPSRKGRTSASAAKVRAQYLKAARKLREHVEKNADYVGDRFADKARELHYSESESESEGRGIYGEASKEQVGELSDEGIDTFPLPNLPEDQN